MSLPNVSSDLVWEIVRNSNSYLVKSKVSGGVYFSRDPYNLTNLHSRKHAGFVNDKAVSVAQGKEGGVHLSTKKAKSLHQPAKSTHNIAIGSRKAGRKTYKAVASSTAKNSYRPDLRQAAVARASAIRRSQLPVKADREQKLRGSAAKKAANKE